MFLLPYPLCEIGLMQVPTKWEFQKVPIRCPQGVLCPFGGIQNERNL